MNIWHDIEKERITKDDFIGVVEITKGGSNKYELDKATGMLKLDRVLYTATHYPTNYGFIPRTIDEDGDPLDVLVLCSEPIEPMSLVRCYPIGVMYMVDSGDNDDKIIAIPYGDPTYNCYTDINQLPSHIFEEIKNLLLRSINEDHIEAELRLIFEDKKYEYMIISFMLGIASLLISFGLNIMGVVIRDGEYHILCSISSYINIMLLIIGLLLLLGMRKAGRFHEKDT